MIAPPLEHPLLQGVLSISMGEDFEIWKSKNQCGRCRDDELWIQFAPPYYRSRPAHGSLVPRLFFARGGKIVGPRDYAHGTIWFAHRINTLVLIAHTSAIRPLFGIPYLYEFSKLSQLHLIHFCVPSMAVMVLHICIPSVLCLSAQL